MPGQKKSGNLLNEPHSTDIRGKGMNPIILLPPMNK